MSTSPCSIGKPLDASPDSIPFPSPLVDIMKKNDDGRVKMFADDTDMLKLAFIAHGANDKPDWMRIHVCALTK